MPLSVPAASTTYIKVPLVSSIVNGATVDPTGDAVALAIVASGTTPASGDWHTGSWETVNGTHLARLLIGPNGGLALTAGTYDIWTRITDNPETPVNRVDVLRVF